MTPTPPPSPGMRPAGHSAGPLSPAEHGFTSPPCAASPRSVAPADLTPPRGRQGIGLTERQAETLAFITAYLAARGGIAPSNEEIRQRLGLEAKSGVVRILNALEERGHIRRLKHRARAIEVISPAPVAQPSLNGEPLMFVPVHSN